MAAKLTALGGQPYQPPEYRCCLCRRPNAARGFNDRFYCTPCVPPPMRFPSEAGYEPPGADATTLVPAPAAAPDLFSGLGSA